MTQAPMRTTSPYSLTAPSSAIRSRQTRQGGTASTPLRIFTRRSVPPQTRPGVRFQDLRSSLHRFGYQDVRHRRSPFAVSGGRFHRIHDLDVTVQMFRAQPFRMPRRDAVAGASRRRPRAPFRRARTHCTVPQTSCTAWSRPSRTALVVDDLLPCTDPAASGTTTAIPSCRMVHPPHPNPLPWFRQPAILPQQVDQPCGPGRTSISRSALRTNLSFNSPPPASHISRSVTELSRHRLCRSSSMARKA